MQHGAGPFCCCYSQCNSLKQEPCTMFLWVKTHLNGAAYLKASWPFIPSQLPFFSMLFSRLGGTYSRFYPIHKALFSSSYFSIANYTYLYQLIYTIWSIKDAAANISCPLPRRAKTLSGSLKTENEICSIWIFILLKNNMQVWQIHYKMCLFKQYVSLSIRAHIW